MKVKAGWLEVIRAWNLRGPRTTSCSTNDKSEFSRLFSAKNLHTCILRRLKAHFGKQLKAGAGQSLCLQQAALPWVRLRIEPLPEHLLGLRLCFSPEISSRLAKLGVYCRFAPRKVIGFNNDPLTMNLRASATLLLLSHGLISLCCTSTCLRACSTVS